MWFRTRGSCARSLAMIFGQTATPMYKWLKFGCQVLLHVLSRTESAKVKSPSEAQVCDFQAAVSKKYPTCSDVWGAADRIKLSIQSPLSHQIQLRFYNRGKSNHTAKLLLFFFQLMVVFALL